MEENTVIGEERVEHGGVVVLGPLFCVMARLLMERSMGEQLEKGLSASLLSLVRLLS